MIVTERVFLSLLESIKGGERRIRVQGLTGSSKAFFLSQLEIPRTVFGAGARPIAVITSIQEEAERFYEDILFFRTLFSSPHLLKPLFFPSVDIFSYGLPHQDIKILGNRINILSMLAEGDDVILITSVEAIMGHLPSKSEITNKRKILKIDDSVNRDLLVEELIDIGYRRVPMVAETGEFSIRGGIIDIYSPYHTNPLRIDLFGDTIESIREFDQGTQRSLKNLDEGILLPLMEDTGNSSDTFFDYLSEDCLIIFDEPSKIEEKIKGIAAAQREDTCLMPEEIARRVRDFQLITLEFLQVPEKGTMFTFDTESIEGQGLRGIPLLAERLKEWKKTYRVFLICNTIGQGERLRDLLIEYDVDCHVQDSRPQIEDVNIFYPVILVGRLSKGFLFPALGTVFITEGEIFGEKLRRKTPSKSRLENFLKSIEEIQTGDYIVHVDYGIGRYLGIKRLKVDSYESDFLLINYAGDDKLYLPLDRIDRVQRYVGPEGSVPELHRLGGVLWQRTKDRIKKEMEEMATELLELYASREVLGGHSFSSDSYLHKEFDSSFEYEETPDQTTAIEDIKKDMEGKRPMDRLVCGDVGYGKTEVAMRASFKAVNDSKQVAILVPTTILAEQHYQTFSERFSSFPVRIEVLSRFKNKKEQKRVLEELAEGTVDIIIGTHRLLQKDVQFKDLGLLVVDEEQRFGVSHKEKIKGLRKTVDVLTLTATPIPRTLHMALSAVRDLSVIDTPPEDRLSVKTMIAKFDKRVIRDAILTEIARGGQVFFVHNRVKSLERMFDYLKRIVPEARIATAHGQMKEKDLERVMISFTKKEVDILLTSAIIESGLDIPSANTILINRADKFGLADLYQLRGRVGRSNRRAYAYFLIPGAWALTEDARKRLKAIQELSELGAGFKIAMRDLEIRGAGNLLGPQQSGHIAALGFDLYVQMLEKTVLKIKGEDTPSLEYPVMDIKLSAFIPEDYIPDVSQRLSVYRKIASVRAEQGLSDIREELRDRFGEIPIETMRLLDIVDLKILAAALRIKRIEKDGEMINIAFDEKAELAPEKIIALLNMGSNHIRFINEYTIQLVVGNREWSEIYRDTKKFLQEILGCVTKSSNI